MATPVMMPNVGISVESCILTEWHKKKGDAVKKATFFSPMKPTNRPLKKSLRLTESCLNSSLKRMTIFLP